MSNPNAWHMASPSMVLSAFTIELFLKCLLLLEGKEIDPTHHLNVLWKKLSHKRKRRIEEAWDKEARPKIIQINQQFGLGVPSDLPNALVRCGRAFEHIRYGYEDPDRQIFTSVTYLQFCGGPSLTFGQNGQRASLRRYGRLNF
jgi:hypothetical protein